jgi:glycosyltransferase involved in cell wall biosynthesis
MQQPGTPHEVLVVGWSPAIDDPVAGRFVADQAAALRASGRVRPYLASWEQVSLAGDGPLRRAQAAAADRVLARGRSVHPRAAVEPGAFGPDGVPVARMTTLAGPLPGLGPDHQATHRWAALQRVLDAPDAPRPVLVHGHVGYPEGVAAARIADRLGLPFVLTEHASYLARIFAEPALLRAYGAAARRASRVVPVSGMLSRELVAAFPDLESRIVVIPNTVAVEEFRAAPTAGRRTDELLWVGHRRPGKGIDTLLTAFRVVLRERPGATLRLVGRSTNAEEEAEWQRLAAELGVAASVRFEGPADRGGVAAAMERASLFVHASRRETFGVVAAEALAAGLPVVATDSGGVTEILGSDPEALGAVVPPDDPDALGAAILRTLERRESFDPDALRAHVVHRYGAAAVAGRIADLYDEVLAEWPAARAATVPVTMEVPPPTAAARGSPAAPTALEWEPGAMPIVVVGFGRRQLDQLLEALPAEFRVSLCVVTVGDALPGVRRAVLAPEGTREALARLAGQGVRVRSGPLGRLVMLAARARRVLLRPRGGRRDRVLAVLRDTVARAVEEEDGRPLVIALGGIDYLAVDAAPAEAYVPAAGGVRWLGDRWWAARAGSAAATPKHAAGPQAESPA